MSSAKPTAKTTAKTLRFSSASCLLVLATMIFPSSGFGAFVFQDDGQALTILENDAPVLVYRYGMVEPPERVDAKFRRACYIHPLYGLDGEVLTQDFPFDHRHHRGVFWAWPKSTVGGRAADVWALEGIRQVHEAFVERRADAAEAVIAVRNGWVYDDEPGKAVVREHVRFVVHPVGENTRAIDFELTFENASGEEVVISGSSAEDKGVTKGYGGFCLRPDATRSPMRFTAVNGVEKEDALSLETPWCDVSFPVERKDDKLSGVAIFQHPRNPGYPHPGWILRHYGFLGVSWPHTVDHPLAPGASVTLRYRMWIHRGDADAAGIPAAFAAYTSAAP
ncbi:MAG TPA: PmoA family protein [Candidatus Hydrogenedentes bacterium]|nr:PmoA family protein [Candidatus Hydrogenedentota bacterium]HNT88063.1 PmoA family protein [Candidatus Hydrogenedentota bacterium]